MPHTLPTKKTKGIRVGMGPLRRDGSEISLQHVHAEFMKATTAVAPTLGTSLRELIHVVDSARFPSPEHMRTEALTRLSQWAHANRILSQGRPPHWLLSKAKRTLEYWAKDPKAAEALKWSGVTIVTGFTEHESEIHLAWDPIWETRESAHARLDARLDEIEKHARDKGAVVNSPRRDSGHFEWLARYLVNREHPVDIKAGEPLVGLQGVKKAIRETAQLAGLDMPLFPPSPYKKRGRPLGSRGRHPRDNS